MNKPQPSRAEQILDLLIDEIRVRMRAAGEVEPVTANELPIIPVAQDTGSEESDIGPDDEELLPAGLETMPDEPFVALEDSAESTVSANLADETGAESDDQVCLLPLSEDELDETSSTSAGPSHAALLLKRLAIWVCVAVVLINIPFTRHRTTLATAMPDAASYIIRDGFVVKEEDDEEIYVYQDGKFRWISSLDAFEHYGYTWGDVHIVPDGYLNWYEVGPPLHVLLKCRASPHIYRLEREKKRWIRDIDTFVDVGHVWEDVRFVSCQYLRDLPDGETIPPDSGPPPQP